MKVNTKEELFDLEKKKIGTVGERVAEILSFSRTKKDPVKLYELALKFRKGPEVELDESDYDLVESEVKEAEAAPVVTGQIIKIIREQRRAQDAKAEAEKPAEEATA